jgi:hypothetical protein
MILLGVFGRRCFGLKSVVWAGFKPYPAKSGIIIVYSDRFPGDFKFEVSKEEDEILCLAGARKVRPERLFGMTNSRWIRAVPF